MGERRSVPLALVLLASACANPALQREQDLAEVADGLRERLGVEVPREPDAGGLAPEAAELLGRPLTEDSAVKLAVLNNRRIRAALAELGVASSELVQAGLLANPVFTANAKFFDDGTEIELGLVASFFDVFFRSARKHVAEAELEAVKARVSRTVVGLAYDVRRAFVVVRASERLLDVEREALGAAQASFDLMSELHRAGNVADPALTAEELALAEARRAVAAAESAAAEAREPLNVLLGLRDGTLDWTVDGALDDDAGDMAGLEGLAERALAASFDLAENRAAALAEARRAGLSDWEAVFDPGQIGLVAKNEVNGAEWGVGPAFGIGLPVTGAGEARRARSEALLEQALAGQRVLEVQIASAARRLRERSRSANARATAIRDTELPLAARLLRETLRNYNAMQIGVFDVLAVKQRQDETARRQVETLREAWLARLDLEELLAGHLNPARIAAEPSASGHAPADPRGAAH